MKETDRIDVRLPVRRGEVGATTIRFRRVDAGAPPDHWSKELPLPPNVAYEVLPLPPADVNAADGRRVVVASGVVPDERGAVLSSYALASGEPYRVHVPETVAYRGADTPFA